MKSKMEYIRLFFTIFPITFLTMWLIYMDDAQAQRVLILTAMPQELEVIQELSQNHPNVTSHLIGIGKVQSATQTQKLILGEKPQLVILSGVAGGISESLHIGDVLVSSGYFQHDYGFLSNGHLKTHPLGTMPEVGLGQDTGAYLSKLEGQKINQFFSEKVRPNLNLKPVPYSKGQRQPQVVFGVFATGDQFVADEVRKSQLRQLGADGVDMEAASVCFVAVSQGVECLVVKAISDVAGDEAVTNFPLFLKSVQVNNFEILDQLLGSLSSQ